VGELHDARAAERLLRENELCGRGIFDRRSVDRIARPREAIQTRTGGRDVEIQVIWLWEAVIHLVV
jgi:hypothetical protein